MAKVLQARKTLIKALLQALGSGSMDSFVSDFRQEEPGPTILAIVNVDGSPTEVFQRLLDRCQNYPGGLDHFGDVIDVHFSDGRLAWPELHRSFLAYRRAVERNAPSDQSAVFASMPHQEATMTEPPPCSQKVYISYAWGDSTPEGKRRAALADNLCNAMQEAGITVLQDRNQVKPGDRISAFMKELAKGDLVLVVLSDRYLKSENCMFELYSIWQRAQQDQELFLKRVIPLILPDAQLRSTGEKLARGEYWLEQKLELEACVTNGSLDAMGPIIFSKYDLIKQLSQHTADMLELLTDKCEPRDFDRQAQEGFREVLDQILAARKAAGG